MTEAIARQLGNALVAPIIRFVPEGTITPPSGHMKYPGTISVREATFAALLTDVCSSLRQHGFTDIILIGDHGENQRGMQTVAERLNKQWRLILEFDGSGSAKVVCIVAIEDYH